MGCGGSSDTAKHEPDQSGDENMPPGSKPVDSPQLRSEYTLGSQIIGQGAFGVVYPCAKNSDPKNFKYAVKMVDKVETPVPDIKKEAEMLKKLKHENVVKFHAIYYEKFFVCIVMDRYEGGDMIEGMQLHWKTKGQIPCSKIVHVSRQMSAAIDHLHTNCVVHRDVKGDNYLMDRKDLTDPECKIIMSDFGTAVTWKGVRLSAPVGTKIYWPPEFYEGNYGLKVDCWALGVIMYGLLVGKFPFRGEEQDARNKVVKLPGHTPQKCQTYILALLEKKEEKRLTAAQALGHPWHTSSAGDESLPLDPAFRAEGLIEQGANAGVAERRKELLERQENAGQKNRKDPQNIVMSILCQPCFEVHNKHTNRSLRYEWWTAARVEEEDVINLSGAKVDATDGMCSTQSIRVVDKMLAEHDIDTSKWGQGAYKSLEKFAAEVHSGKALLMLDATRHKNLVRVVDVVLLRITYMLGGKTKLFLTEFSEELGEGRSRQLNRIPGTKKEPHENTKTTAERILKEYLNMGECQVVFDFVNKEVFEDESVGFTYPDVRTVYRKEIIEGQVTTNDAAVLKRVGLGTGRKAKESTYSNKTPDGYSKVFAWMQEKDCENNQVKLRAPADGDEVSGLVQAPIGYSEEELSVYLNENDIDPSQFGQNGTKTLKEFSQELVKGEASLMTKKDPTTGKVQVVRVVDVVCLFLKKHSQILVMAEEKCPDGTKKRLNLLPGAKRRPDENQFLTAQRILKRQLKLDENCVNLNNKDVRILEEEKSSPSYPGLHTTYKKRIISADLIVAGAPKGIPQDVTPVEGQGSTAQGSGPKLRVTVRSAQGLYDADGWAAGKSDPYVLCMVPGKKTHQFKTKTISNDLNPTWNQYGFINNYQPDDPLEFQVWDSDTLPSRDLLGKARLESDKFFPSGCKHNLRLLGGKSEAGSLTVEIEVLEAQSYQAGNTGRRYWH